MSYRVIILKADGSITITVQKKKPEYEQLKAAVGGYIETIPYFTKLVVAGVELARGTAYANEEGLLKGLPTNVRAMVNWKAQYRFATQLVGDVIFYAKIPEKKHVASVKVDGQTIGQLVKELK